MPKIEPLTTEYYASSLMLPSKTLLFISIYTTLNLPREALNFIHLFNEVG